MNLRDIKKDIEYVLGAFIDDCAIFATINPKASDEKLSGLLDEAVDLYNELKDKANARKIEGSKAAYFTALRKEILEKTDALYEKLSVIVKEGNEEKPAAKKAPAAKPAAEKAPAKKAAPKAEAAEKPAAKKAPAAKATAKPAAEKAPAKKAAPKAEAAEKPAAKKAPAKKAAPKAEAAEKPAAEKKPAAKKAPAKKAE